METVLPWHTLERSQYMNEMIMDAYSCGILRKTKPCIALEEALVYILSPGCREKCAPEMLTCRFVFCRNNS